ncbi:neuronal acetylcholine receptor subunit alpha-5 isoform X2 [Lingula anatina]|uniref:Neuronal acetylcholine receptor subunit alpha-5 isoform X2 n=1 Tax=Lingula anatina TaxID=7574 RepID=A0A1S3K6M9_LINAN|nr:neuronal acetylcholine receptor subunit alpha-5 isoform X2 [Lingula anatina]|eukprot:XP_013418084.1 neuronal acetylcholine receptor subunit alpha-5 isoform X2 [Lingula anatina]
MKVIWKSVSLFKKLHLVVLLDLFLGSIAVSDEKRLISHLLKQYNDVGVVGRPVENFNDTIRVSFGIALIQILDLDEKNQVLTTNCWSRYAWKDKLLAWNPKNYSDVKTIRVPTDQIWKPDIVLYNYADTRLKERREALAVVSNDGQVMWIPQAIFKSSCNIDITYFPFDIQECNMKFGSWTYDGFQLDVFFYDGEKVDLKDYVESNEWVVMDSPAKKNVKTYPCCPEPFPDLTFTIRFRRKVAFYNYILVLPCVLLSTLTLALFWMPPESPAKMQLGMNIFVAFFLLLLLLKDLTPPSAKVPLIGAYFCLNMILITLSTFLSTIVINLYFRGAKRRKAPNWLKRVMLDGFAKIMCMTDETYHVDQRGAPKMEGVKLINNKEKKKNKVPELKYNKYQMCECGVSMQNNSSSNNTGDWSNPPDKSPVNITALESEIRDIRRCARSFMNRIAEKDANTKKCEEWRVIALVLDRLFFYMYLIAIVVSICAIFPRSHE